jgi:hypothetical protein
MATWVHAADLDGDGFLCPLGQLPGSAEHRPLFGHDDHKLLRG